MKLKPVFDDKKRDTERDLDIERELDTTTISRVENVVDSVEKKETPNMVTKEEAESMARQYANEASEQAVNIALERYDNRRRGEDDRRKKEIEAERKRDEDDREKRRRKREEEDDGDNSSLSVINPKVVKQLKDTVSIFTALKELSSNPLQKTIEETVGGMAAGVVQKAFMPHQEPQKKDLVDQILNSQFAYGLGSGMGQRAPELVETFGREKVDGWITGAIKGGGGGGIGGLGGIPGAPPPGIPPGMGGQTKQQSEMEMILSLDCNNPEHVAAYAHSQGDISVGTARKVLMIHQDDFIRQLDLKGVDTTQYKLRRSQEKEMPNSDDIYGGNVGNVQEYRPAPRINDDLIVNTPATEDKKWERENENEKSDAYVNNLETQNVELHPQMERVEQNRVEPGIASNSGEIINYLKSLKDMVEKQGNEMSSLKQELDMLKRDRTTPEDILRDRDNKEEKNIEKNVDNRTTVRSMKMIKKGFSYVKAEE